MFKKKLIDPEQGSVSLRCFVVQRETYFVAVCLDVCLAAQDETLEGAKQKLHDQVLDYMMDAFEEKNFDMRPAPLEHWVTYYKLKAQQKAQHHLPKLAARLADAAGSKLFREKLPLRINHHAA